MKTLITPIIFIDIVFFLGFAYFYVWYNVENDMLRLFLFGCAIFANYNIVGIAYKLKWKNRGSQ